MIRLIVILALALCSAARAQDLPGGVTCDQVVQYASMFNIPDTTLGRVRARVIAAALGMRLTNAQLDAAAKCLRQYRLDQEYGCTVKQQAPNGDCK